ncbi:uncharacterized protein LOC143190853 [Rhynchophorus ferrugineus]|uniref:uncharacterized protein LOC143190853 n=1 Tax=Rhynchophorus ferrugineus TaxID=354439 RepID=UPI003FCD418E
MINPITGSETNKKVSSMNYYSYRLMIRENEDNHILKCRRLYHKYVVDMYVKIETERLTFIRLNLRDAINTDGNAQNVGRMTILPATYIGSPRHMHEYAQDAMSYVRHYGTADLFITFTCNPQWIEIKQELFPGQSPIDRHDITARLFRQKLKSLMNFIVKHNVFDYANTIFRKDGHDLDTGQISTLQSSVQGQKETNYWGDRITFRKLLRMNGLPKNY